MATLSYILIDPNRFGKYQIYLQIIHSRKTLTLGMDNFVDKNHWQPKLQAVTSAHTNSKRLNNLLSSRMVEAEDLVIAFDKAGQPYTSLEIKKELMELWGLGKKVPVMLPVEIVPSPLDHIKTPVTFFDFVRLHVSNLRRVGNYHVSTEQSKFKHFQEYLLSLEIAKQQASKRKTPIPLESIDIAFSDITVTLLKSYIAYISSTLKVGKEEETQRSVKERTITNHLIAIRTIYNQGINNGAATKDAYPFGRGKIPIKIPQSLKVGLNEEDVKKLEAFAKLIPTITDFSFIRERKINNGLNQKLTALKKRNPNAELNDEDKARLAQIDLWRDQYLKHAVNVWLVSFYFAGMRISDTLLLKWSDFQNGRLYYTMGKNRKPGSLKVPEKILGIIEEYRCDEQKHDLIFPELKVLDNLDDLRQVKLKIANADGRLNDALSIVGNRAEIDKDIKPHGSRHAFGNIAGDQISIQQLQKLYRHTNITTTVNYQASFMHKDADEALDAVINF
jgi:integrase/recombinase XerD